MEIRLLKGGIARLRLKNKQFQIHGKSRSHFQHRIGILLTERYPHDRIFEEVTIPGDGFILDFFIPSLKLVIECHGLQHIKHIKHFHKTKSKFHWQQKQDQKKRDWCILNHLRLEEIYDE